ncbi:MAG: polysaccharide biosynthesis protein, partial [Pseudomonadota bacterium]
MTRFNILLDECVDLVLHALNRSLGGELFVKKIPSFRNDHCRHRHRQGHCHVQPPEGHRPLRQTT